MPRPSSSPPKTTAFRRCLPIRRAWTYWRERCLPTAGRKHGNRLSRWPAGSCCENRTVRTFRTMRKRLRTGHAQGGGACVRCAAAEWIRRCERQDRGHEPDYIPLSQVADPRQEALQAALRTRVFTSSQHRAPAHRQIAEYLAGRHLAHLIAQGLPARRIIALMTGQDGGIVSGMRGLAAWLAARRPAEPARPHRTRPFRRDPLRRRQGLHHG